MAQEMANPQPTLEPEPRLHPQPQNPLNAPRQCRYIKAGGEQCRGRATRGHHYCQSHRFNRQPTFTGVKGSDHVAFLEDTASIQLAASQILNGLLDRIVEPDRARATAALLNVANTALRDLRAHERWLLQNKHPLPEQVAETTLVESESLGPDRPWIGPTSVLEPQAALSQDRCEPEGEHLGRPEPTSADSIWLAEDETTEQDDNAIVHCCQAELAELERNRSALEACLPSPHAEPTLPDRHCPFSIDGCEGLFHPHSCDYCKGERVMTPSDSRYPGDEVIAKIAHLREELKQKEELQRPDQAPTPATCNPQPESSPAPASPTCNPSPAIHHPTLATFHGPRHVGRAQKAPEAESEESTTSPGLDLQATAIPEPGTLTTSLLLSPVSCLLSPVSSLLSPLSSLQVLSPGRYPAITSKQTACQTPLLPAQGPRRRNGDRCGPIPQSRHIQLHSHNPERG